MAQGEGIYFFLHLLKAKQESNKQGYPENQRTSIK